MSDAAGRYGRCFGGSAKYKALVLDIQEYPVNKKLIEILEGELAPAPAALRMPDRSGPKPKPTEIRAVQISELRHRVALVEKALKVVPKEYREGVLYHTLNYGTKAGSGPGAAWTDDRFDFAHRNTWKRWKARFILEYARLCGELDYINLLIEYEDELQKM